jgi:hypothetical protein
LKTGYAAGAVAGFIVGIPALIIGAFILPWYGGLSLSELLQFLPFTATQHLGINIIWGFIWGVLFAKFYDVIPGGSGVKKGLFWGLIYAIIEWWCGVYAFAYGQFWGALLWAIYGPVVIFFYGLPLGLLYEGTQQPVKPEDKTRHKPIADIIAGLVIGIVAAIFTFVRLMMGIPSGWDLPLITPWITNVIALDFVLAFIWGIIFSIIFVLLYARLPGRNVMKGLYYGLLIYLITVVYIIFVGLWNFSYIEGYFLAIGYGLVTNGLAFICYGLVLGYFYKK